MLQEQDLSPYTKDAVNHTIPLIIKDIEELFDGCEDVREQLHIMNKMRNALRRAYAERDCKLER